jgi:hypothetical protein
MKRWLAMCALLLLAACAEGDRRYRITADSGFEPVTLTLENAGEEPLRCTLVLAHFITKEADEIAPGGRLEVLLERRPGDGVLASGRHKGEPMLVENLLCGAQESWQATSGDVPLLPVRRGREAAYRLTCVAEGRFSCETN